MMETGKPPESPPVGRCADCGAEIEHGEFYRIDLQQIRRHVDCNDNPGHHSAAASGSISQ